MFTLRPATNTDGAAVRDLIFSVLQEYGLAPDPAQTDADLNDIETFYFKQGGYFGVVEEQGVVIATVGLIREDGNSCELRKMYALPSVRGRGLGRFLMDSAIEKAREWQCDRISLETASVLKQAIQLYRKYGFQEFHPDQITCRCDTAMELLLSADSSIKNKDK